MNLFSLMATLGLDSSAYESGLDKAEGQANSFGQAFKKGVGTAIKVTGAAISAAATGLTALTKSAIDSYADYEQLVGGVETLFGENADAVIKNADAAFKTAGLSVNQYMETSIQSAAALINSLGGDTEQAAKLIDMSIVDMADNVNKMGTTMESVQNAYRGFSRGNFTMLDNLALGFSGTKQGMEELLAKAQELSGVEYDISSYADIVQAIHVVQEEIGIAGTTQLEAAETISGSLSSLKSAWTNLVTGLAAENSNIELLVNNLVDGIQTSLQNIIPTVERVLSVIGSAINKVVPMGASIVIMIADAIVDNLPVLFNSALEIIGALGSALIDNLPKIISAAVDIVIALIDGIGEALPILISYIPTIIETIANLIIDNLPLIVSAAFDMIEALAEGIVENLPAIIDAMALLIADLVEFILDNLPDFIDRGMEIVNALLEGLLDALPKINTTVGTLIASLIQSIIQHLPEILIQGTDILIQLITGLLSAIPQLVAAIPQIIRAIVQAFAKADWSAIGKSILDGIGEGFTKFGNDLVNGAKKAVSGLVDGIKDFFGIHSPSKVFENEIGKNLGLGLAEGIDESAQDAVKSAEEMAKDVLKTMDGMDTAINASVSGLELKPTVSAENGLTTAASGVTINVYGAIGQDVSELAEIVSQKIAFATQRERAAWA